MIFGEKTEEQKRVAELTREVKELRKELLASKLDKKQVEVQMKDLKDALEPETGQFILRLCIQNMTICFSVMMTLRQLTMMLTRMGKWQLIFQRWLLTAMIRLT